MKEDLFPGPAVKILELGKYLPFRSRVRRLVGAWSIRQACFPSKAKLKFSKSLKPSPPSFFGSPILFQETQCIALFPGFLFHHKFAKMLFISSHMSLGSLKQFIV